MGFMSFSGRVLFSAFFIFSAWQKINDFGHDGGYAAKSLEPKIDILKGHVASYGVSIPDFELKYVVMAAIALDGLGGILFTLGSSFGGYLLLISLAAFTPIVHDFYNYDNSSPIYAREFIQFLKNLSLIGALLYFIGMKNYAKLKMKKRIVKPKTN